MPPDTKSSRSSSASTNPTVANSALEIEPGTFFVANAGVLVCSVIDVVDTGPNGYNFIKVDAGMTEVLRPSMYGAQHPIHVLPCASTPVAENLEYIIAGHCCESGDVLTPEPDNPKDCARESFRQPVVEIFW